MVLLCPTKSREIEQHPSFLDLVRPIRAPPLTAGIGGIEDEVAHPLGMLGRVLDRGRAASAGTDQGEAPERGRVDYALEIAHARLERKIADVAVRQSAAADVMAQDLVFTGKNIKPRTPGKTTPLVFEVGDPGRRHHQRRTYATDGIG